MSNANSDPRSANSAAARWAAGNNETNSPTAAASPTASTSTGGSPNSAGRQSMSPRNTAAPAATTSTCASYSRNSPGAWHQYHGTERPSSPEASTTGSRTKN